MAVEVNETLRQNLVELKALGLNSCANFIAVSKAALIFSLVGHDSSME